MPIDFINRLISYNDIKEIHRTAFEGSTQINILYEICNYLTY